MLFRGSIYRSHYETLGLGFRATPLEIKTAFRNLAKKWHPDQNSNDEGAELKFRRIKEAYECLSDKQRRVEYDKDLLRVGRARFSEKHGPIGGSDSVPDDGSCTKSQLVFLYSFALGLPFIVSVIRNRSESSDRETHEFVLSNFHASPPLPEASFRDRLVRAYYNPVSKQWERLEDGQEPPSPLELFRRGLRENRGAFAQTFQTV